MRKLRIAYYILFSAFVLAIESMLIYFSIVGGARITNSNFSFVLYVLPVLCVLPICCLFWELMMVVKERKAIKLFSYQEVKLVKVEEFKNLLYSGYRLKLKYTADDGKDKYYWTPSDFTKSQTVNLKQMQTFKAFVYKDKVFVKVNMLDMAGDFNREYKRRTRKPKKKIAQN